MVVVCKCVLIMAHIARCALGVQPSFSLCCLGMCPHIFVGLYKPHVAAMGAKQRL